MRDRFDFDLEQARPQSGVFAQASTQPGEVQGVLDLLSSFDVFLFSLDTTLFKNAMASPGAATLVPTLRQKSKRVGVFTLREWTDRDEATQFLNRGGFSFTGNRVLLRDELHQLEDRFPLVARSRILMICGDVFSELSLAKTQQLNTLLVGPNWADDLQQGTIFPDFVASSV